GAEGTAGADLRGARAGGEDGSPARVHVAAGVLRDAAVRSSDEHGVGTIKTVRVGADIRRPAGYHFGPVRPEPPRPDPLVRRILPDAAVIEADKQRVVEVGILAGRELHGLEAGAGAEDLMETGVAALTDVLIDAPVGPDVEGIRGIGHRG